MNKISFDQMETSQSLTPIVEEEIKNIFKKKDFNYLKAENIINLTYIQDDYNQPPNWQLEDYFVL